MLDLNKIEDKMEPREFRFRNGFDYQEIFMPVTKNGEQYYLLKKEYKDNIRYYVVSEDNKVIGRFIVGGDSRKSGLTYHIVPDYQNRGIGQLVLSVIVEDAFSLNIESLILHPTNERSAAIAIKNGFKPMNMRIEYFKLTKLDYQNKKEKSYK